MNFDMPFDIKTNYNNVDLHFYKDHLEEDKCAELGLKFIHQKFFLTDTVSCYEVAHLINGTDLYDSSFVCSDNLKWIFCDRSLIPDLSAWDTSNCYTFEHMFENVDTNELDLTSFRFDKARSLSMMLDSCKIKRILFSQEHTFLQTFEMNQMFNNCSELEEVRFPNFKNVLQCNAFLAGCKKLKYIDLHNFDSSLITQINGSFKFLDCKELDLRYWDLSKCKIKDLFLDSKIYCLNLSYAKLSDDFFDEINYTLAEIKFVLAKGLPESQIEKLSSINEIEEVLL